MPPRSMRATTRKAAVSLPQHSKFVFLSEASKQLADIHGLAQVLGSRALKVSDIPDAAVTRREVQRLCVHCGVHLCPSTCASVKVVTLSSKSRKRSRAAMQGQPGQQPNTVSIVRQCKVCHGLNRQMLSNRSAAENIAAKETSELQQTGQKIQADAAGRGPSLEAGSEMPHMLGSAATTGEAATTDAEGRTSGFAATASDVTTTGTEGRTSVSAATAGEATMTDTVGCTSGSAATASDVTMTGAEGRTSGSVVAPGDVTMTGAEGLMSGSVVAPADVTTTGAEGRTSGSVVAPADVTTTNIEGRTSGSAPTAGDATMTDTEGRTTLASVKGAPSEEDGAKEHEMSPEQLTPGNRGEDVSTTDAEGRTLLGSVREATFEEDGVKEHEKSPEQPTPGNEEEVQGVPLATEMIRPLEPGMEAVVAQPQGVPLAAETSRPDEAGVEAVVAQPQGTPLAAETLRPDEAGVEAGVAQPQDAPVAVETLRLDEAWMEAVVAQPQGAPLILETSRLDGSSDESRAPKGGVEGVQDERESSDSGLEMSAEELGSAASVQAPGVEGKVEVQPVAADLATTNMDQQFPSTEDVGSAAAVQGPGVEASTVESCGAVDTSTDQGEAAVVEGVPEVQLTGVGSAGGVGVDGCGGSAGDVGGVMGGGVDGVGGVNGGGGRGGGWGSAGDRLVEASIGVVESCREKAQGRVVEGAESVGVKSDGAGSVGVWSVGAESVEGAESEACAQGLVVKHAESDVGEGVEVGSCIRDGGSEVQGEDEDKSESDHSGEDEGEDEDKSESDRKGEDEGEVKGEDEGKSESDHTGEDEGEDKVQVGSEDEDADEGEDDADEGEDDADVKACHEDVAVDEDVDEGMEDEDGSFWQSTSGPQVWEGRGVATRKAQPISSLCPKDSAPSSSRPPSSVLCSDLSQAGKQNVASRKAQARSSSAPKESAPTGSDLHSSLNQAGQQGGSMGRIHHSSKTGPPAPVSVCESQNAADTNRPRTLRQRVTAEQHFHFHHPHRIRLQLRAGAYKLSEVKRLRRTKVLEQALEQE